ncbi:hypothetical protein U9Z24_12515 [Escherichia coli]
MSTITKEFTKEQLIEQAKKNIEVLRGAVQKIPGASDAAVIHLKLAEITLASLETEPVAFVMADDLKDSSIISTPAYRDLGEAMERTVGDVVALYAAPPASVTVQDYPDVLPCPVMLELGLRFGKGVPTKTMLGALQRRAEHYAELDAMTPEQRTEHDAGMKEFAAMLQGAEPVKAVCKLPANTPCKDAPEHIWLQTAGVWPENGEFSELTWCSDNQHPDDTLYVRADVVPGNSPVIPDWQTQAEKMAELYGSSFVLFRNGESPQCADPTKVIISFTDEGLGHGAEAHFREIVNSSTNNCRENAETSTKCWCRTCRPVTVTDSRFVVCPECGNKRCPHANDHRNACTGSNETGQEGSAYPAAPQQEVK